MTRDESHPSLGFPAKGLKYGHRWVYAGEQVSTLDASVNATGPLAECELGRYPNELGGWSSMQFLGASRDHKAMSEKVYELLPF